MSCCAHSPSYRCTKYTQESPGDLRVCWILFVCFHFCFFLLFLREGDSVAQAGLELVTCHLSLSSARIRDLHLSVQPVVEFSRSPSSESPAMPTLLSDLRFTIMSPLRLGASRKGVISESSNARTMTQTFIPCSPALGTK